MDLVIACQLGGLDAVSWDLVSFLLAWWVMKENSWAINLDSFQF